MIDINGDTVITGVIGSPIRHTLSPDMHNRSFASLGLNYVYLPFLVQPAVIKTAVASIRAFGFRGINVTIPHKQSVIRYLDSIDALAGKIRAVNTIVNRNGKLTGYNTDAYGFIEPLRKKLNPKGKNIFLFGAGGVARAIGYILCAYQVKKIYVTDKDNVRASALVRSLGVRYAEYVPYEKIKIRHIMRKTDVLVNASPVGMKQGDRSIVRRSMLHQNMFVYDVVYNRKTQLVKDAEAEKLSCLDGVDMFVHQGAAAFTYWTGRKAPLDVMYKAVKEGLKKQR